MCSDGSDWVGMILVLRGLTSEWVLKFEKGGWNKMSLVCIGRSRVDMGESLTPREHEIYANHQYNGGRVKAYAKLTAGLLPVTYDGELAVRTVPMVGTGQR